jgi:alpha-glutamyl/putrescinyl thymine pyrophosphorylase clade 1
MSLRKPVSTPVFETFWRFAAERQNIFFRRLNPTFLSWTKDPILQRYKFTNAYRASDRVSQYLIRNVIYEGDQSPTEIFFRTVIFKLFNRIETWKWLHQTLGLPTAAEYNVDAYDDALNELHNDGEKIYSGAYIMPSPTQFGAVRKHRNHLLLIQQMLRDKLPDRLADAPSLKSVYLHLKSYASIGNFLAYQLAIDLNYSKLFDFSEMEFVEPGPGALDGIRKCFYNLGDYTPTEVIRLASDTQSDEFHRWGIDFRSLWGRPLQLVDCQNLFCEVDKYARLAHPEFRGVRSRSRIKQLYRPQRTVLDPWYPPKWGLNHFLNSKDTPKSDRSEESGPISLLPDG